MVFTLLLLVLIAIASVFIRFRWSKKTKVQIQGEVVYVAIELGQKDVVRFNFESVLGNKRVHLRQTTQDLPWVYLTKYNFEKLKISSNENYSFQALFTLKPLVFGGMVWQK
jgi:hypothetical protein